MITITDEAFKKILYHLNDFMGLMRFGREYNKIVDLCMELNLYNYDLADYPYIEMEMKGHVSSD
jgi:hypothetical protein